MVLIEVSFRLYAKAGNSAEGVARWYHLSDRLILTEDIDATSRNISGSRGAPIPTPSCDSVLGRPRLVESLTADLISHSSDDVTAIVVGLVSPMRATANALPHQPPTLPYAQGGWSDGPTPSARHAAQGAAWFHPTTFTGHYPTGGAAILSGCGGTTLRASGGMVATADRAEGE